MIECKISNQLIQYKHSIELMEKKVESIINNNAEELVWFLEHEPIYTAGTSTNDNELLIPKFPLYRSNRGGKITYHGPGQLIVYLLLDLKKRDMKDVKQYVYNLEQIVIDTLQIIEIEGIRLQNKIGVWVKLGDTYKKISAIGIRIKKWVTYHGFSLNINPDLDHYDGIIPCGIADYGITSISVEKPSYTISRGYIIDLLKQNISKRFKE